jgi:hypothetical protein
MLRALAILAASLAFGRAARADDGVLLTDDTWRYSRSGDLAVDAGFATAAPTALATGLALGGTAGLTIGRDIAWGIRAAWLTASESSEVWRVTHRDLRLRATAALEATAGRGTLALRLGVGGTLVHEVRRRNQGMRAGLDDDAREISALAMLPAADLDAVVALHVAGPWRLLVTGGPSIALDRGALRTGWITQLGVGWQP